MNVNIVVPSPPNIAPSLLDLMALWFSENMPELRLNGNAICDSQNWILGIIGVDQCAWTTGTGSKEINFATAADPAFFEKVKAGLEVAKAAKVRLYLATNMEMTPPSVTLAE